MSDNSKSKTPHDPSGMSQLHEQMKLAQQRQAQEAKSGRAAAGTVSAIPATQECFQVELPSRSVLYSTDAGDHVFPNGIVRLRPMGSAEENLIFSPGGDAYTKIDTIINNCYLDGARWNPQELLVVDRFYLLFMLRINMFGKNYKTDFGCRYCDYQDPEMEMDLMEDLDVVRMDDGTIEPFNVRLPHKGSDVTFRLLRGKDEAEIQRFVKRSRMKGQKGQRSGSSLAEDDPQALRFRIARQLVSIDGADVTGNFERAYAFARSLQMGDTNEFRLAVDEVEPGLDTEIIVDCPGCGKTNRTRLPMNEEFFLPSGRMQR